jgi:hypothetical protein
MGIRRLKRGYNETLRKGETLKVNVMMKLTMRMTFLGAAAGAALCLSASSSQAQYSGEARWCAVVAVGTGGVHWDCYYNTVEACTPNVLAGNRGFCGLNPYYGHPSNYTGGVWPGPPAPPVTHYRYYSRHHTHKHWSKS